MSQTYMGELYAFLRELQQHNERPWFAAHRERYDRLRELWLADLQRLVELMGRWEPTLRGVQAKRCAYRIYRDTRFSADKSPFKAFFSATLSGGDKSSHLGAAYYLQMGPGRFDDEVDSGMYGGMWEVPGSVLRKVRRAVVDNEEEFLSIIEEPRLRALCPGWVGAALKTVPKGYAKDHPMAEHLRQKDFGKFVGASEQWFDTPEWPEKVDEVFHIMSPLVNFLNYSIQEEV